MPPVVSEIDTRHATALLLKHHGDDAAARATMWTDTLLAVSDCEAHGVGVATPDILPRVAEW